MNKIFSLIGVLATIVVSTPLAHAGRFVSDNYVYTPAPVGGVHPYDLRYRRTRDQVSLYPYVSDVDIYLSPWRSQTHALHPFNRARYYDRVNYSVNPYTRRVVPVYQRVENEVPLGCNNYAYERPNWRIPPFDYKCQR